MDLVIKKGVVVTANHVRMFGFIQEEGSKVQVFFHFNDYSFLFDCGDGAFVRRPATSPSTFPRKGDTIYYHPFFGQKGWKAVDWVYDFDFLQARSDAITTRCREVRSKPETSRTSWREYTGTGTGTGNHARSDAGPRVDPKSPGYSAPPPPRAPEPKTWREVLGIPIGAILTRDLINAQFRKLALTSHPDRGGSHEVMVGLNKARTEALRFVPH